MNLQERQFGVIAAISGFIAVALGAFGAHALKGNIHATLFDAFETATHYHLIHSVALLAIAVLAAPGTLPRIAAWAFFLGIVLFSGSLYLMAFTGMRSLGIITPFGGIAFLVGWGTLAANFLRR